MLDIAREVATGPVPEAEIKYFTDAFLYNVRPATSTSWRDFVEGLRLYHFMERRI